MSSSLNSLDLARLKSAAKSFGSQKRLSEASGIPIPTIQSILAGKGDPGFSKILALTNALAAPIEALGKAGENSVGAHFDLCGLSDRLRWTIQKCGGYKVAASMIGCGHSSLYNYAKCDPLPGLDILLKLAQASDSCPHWLILGEPLEGNARDSNQQIELTIDPVGLAKSILHQLRLEAGSDHGAPPVNIGTRLKRWFAQ